MEEVNCKQHDFNDVSDCVLVSRAVMDEAKGKRETSSNNHKPRFIYDSCEKKSTHKNRSFEKAKKNAAAAATAWPLV